MSLRDYLAKAYKNIPLLFFLHSYIETSTEYQASYGLSKVKTCVKQSRNTSDPKYCC